MGRSSPTPETPGELRAGDPDASLLAALRAGDEDAFATLVTRYHASLRRVARAYVSTEAVADEVVQETWLAVIDGLDRFESRPTASRARATLGRGTGRRRRARGRTQSAGSRRSRRASSCARRSRRCRPP